MGARISGYQPTTAISIKDHIITVTDLMGADHIGSIPLDIEVIQDDEEYKEDVFALIKIDNKIVILRYDTTYSVIDSETNLLLDVGLFKMNEPNIFKRQYMPVGYMYSSGLVTPLLLDLNNRQMIHGRLYGTVSNGFDYIAKEPIPVGAVIDTDLAQVKAHSHKDKSRKAFVIVDGKEVELYEVARNI